MKKTSTRGPGRPRLVPGQDTISVQVRLDPARLAKAKLLGRGIIAAGVRAAIDASHDQRSLPKMIDAAQKLSKAADFLDHNATYTIRMPHRSIMPFSGDALLRAAAVFAELIEAGNSGDATRIRAALQRVAAIDCNA